MATFDEIINGKGEMKPVGTMRFKELHDHIECADGTTLSVQASRYHYCRPRTDDGPYSHVEVGYPSEAPPDSWAPYIDGKWDRHSRTDTVYGYVPVELVREYIEAHGGEVQR